MRDIKAPGSSARLAAELARDPAFEQAVVMGDTAPLDALGRELFNRRFALLFPIGFASARPSMQPAAVRPPAFPTGSRTTRSRPWAGSLRGPRRRLSKR